MRLSRRKKICYPTFAKYERRPQKSEKKFNWKILIWGGFFVLALGIAIYISVFSSIFKIKTIKTSGNNILTQDQIVQDVKNSLAKKYFNFISSDSFFTLFDNKIKNNLLDAFPEIETLQIKREDFNNLEISVKERKPSAILCLAEIKENLLPMVSSTSSAPVLPEGTSTKPPSFELKETLPQSVICFFVDESGFLYRDAPEISGTILPTFYSFSEESVRLKIKGIEAEYLKFAVQVKKELRQAGIDLSGFILSDKSGPDLKAFTGEGWFIYFDPTRSALAQTKILEAILKDEIKDNRATLQYVDLRVEDRVYYK
jgi:hypothetical protein